MHCDMQHQLSAGTMYKLISQNLSYKEGVSSFRVLVGSNNGWVIIRVPTVLTFWLLNRVTLGDIEGIVQYQSSLVQWKEE